MTRYVSPFVFLLILVFAGCTRNAQYYLERGNKLSAEGKYADAELSYRKAIQKDPNSGETFFQLGQVELKLKRISESYQFLSRAVQLLPKRDDAKVKLADLCLAVYAADPRHPQNLQPLYEKAVNLSDQVYAHDPNGFDALRLKGHVAAF